jgi:hypothetical protein
MQMKLGLQFMNVQSQPIVRQNVGLAHTGLTSEYVSKPHQKL